MVKIIVGVPCGQAGGVGTMSFAVANMVSMYVCYRPLLMG